VDTQPVVAGFGGGHGPGRPLRLRTASPAGRGWRLSAFRGMPVFGVIRWNKQPGLARGGLLLVGGVDGVGHGGGRPAGGAPTARGQVARCGGRMSGGHGGRILVCAKGLAA
jgi:hypothetical protein